MLRSKPEKFIQLHNFSIFDIFNISKLLFEYILKCWFLLNWEKQGSTHCIVNQWLGLLHQSLKELFTFCSLHFYPIFFFCSSSCKFFFTIHHCMSFPQQCLTFSYTIYLDTWCDSSRIDQDRHFVLRWVHICIYKSSSTFF